MNPRIATIEASNGALSLPRLTVLVGPNNCGKSQTLRDIRQYFETGRTERLVILKNVSLQRLTMDDIKSGIHHAPHAVNIDHTHFRGLDPSLEQLVESNLYSPQLNDQLSEEHKLQYFGKFWVAHLNAESRLRIANVSESYDDLSGRPTNAVQEFYAAGSDAMEMMRSAFKRIFDRDIALNWTRLRYMSFVIGSNFGPLNLDKDSLAALFRTADMLEKQGDGYRSLAGVLVSLLVFRQRVILLDEPEAFLHPAQARILGAWLGKFCREHDCQVVVATHNAPFLSGLLSEEPETLVVRLNRSENTTTYRPIPSQVTQKLLKSPLLSSQPVMEALFRKGVVVCESDSDRAIYQTVATRHSESTDADEYLFIHTNGKDGIHTAIEMLRSTHTPVVTIADVDVINSTSVLEKLWVALTTSRPSEIDRQRQERIIKSVEEASDESIVDGMRERVAKWMEEDIIDLRTSRRRLQAIADDAKKWVRVKAEGKQALDADLHGDFDALLASAKGAGLIIVPIGELESWFPGLGRKGHEWNARALNKLQTDCPSNLKDFVTSAIGRLRI